MGTIELTVPDKFFLQVRQIGASDQPDRRSLMRYLETAHDKLSGEPPQDRDFLVDTSDWIRGFSMEAYESSLNQIINYRFGRFLLVCGAHYLRVKIHG